MRGRGIILHFYQNLKLQQTPSENLLIQNGMLYQAHAQKRPRAEKKSKLNIAYFKKSRFYLSLHLFKPWTLKSHILFPDNEIIRDLHWCLGIFQCLSGKYCSAVVGHVKWLFLLKATSCEWISSGMFLERVTFKYLREVSKTIILVNNGRLKWHRLTFQELS